MEAAKRVFILDKRPVEGRLNESFTKPEQSKTALFVLARGTLNT